MRQEVKSTGCKETSVHKNPLPTVDIVIVQPGKGIVLIERRFEPKGWALPGGFVDYGETVECAAMREAMEETGLRVRLEHLLGVYSDPSRDPRRHTISTVFVAIADNPDDVKGGDDAAQARFFSPSGLPQPISFDHASIIEDFLKRHAERYRLIGGAALS